MDLHPIHVSRFPQELYDNVLDHLWDDHRTLVVCGLACRAWLPTVRLHRFHKITLTARNFHQFNKLLDEAPAISEFVWEVAFFMGDRSQKSIRSSMICILARLDNVGHLTLHHWTALDDSDIDDIAALFQNIRTLSLHDTEATANNILRLICACRNLTALHLYYIELWDTQMPPFTATSQVQIEKLVCDHLPAALMEYLLRGSVKMCLRSVNLSWRPDDEDCMGYQENGTAWICNMLKEAGPSLRELTLCPIGDYEDELIDLDISSNVCLVSLRLDILCHLPGGQLAWPSNILSTMRSHCLGRVEVGLCTYPQIPFPFDSLNWDSMDRSLARLAHENKMPEVVFLVLYWREDVASIIHALVPHLRAEKCQLGVVYDPQYVRFMTGSSYTKRKEERWVSLP